MSGGEGREGVVREVGWVVEWKLEMWGVVKGMMGMKVKIWKYRYEYWNMGMWVWRVGVVSEGRPWMHDLGVH